MDVYEKTQFGICIGGFFLVSLAMNFFASYLLSENDYDFRLPLFLSATSHFIHFTLSITAIYLLKTKITFEHPLHSPIPYITRTKIKSSGRISREAEQSRRSSNESLYSFSNKEEKTASPFRKVFLFLRDIGTFNIWIIACSFCGTIDNGFSGYALRSVPLAFYTMLKSCTPIFILLSRFIFQLEKVSTALLGIICTIAFGVFLISKNDTIAFDVWPMAMILLSCMMAGFRWAFLEYFIKNNESRRNSIIYNLCVVSLLMGVFLFIEFLIFEGPKSLLALKIFGDKRTAVECISMIICSSIISFFLCVTEYFIISKTSVITLSVVGIVKEVIIVGISVLQKRVKLHPINLIGLAIATVGVLLFIFRDSLFVREEKRIEAEEIEAESIMSPTSSSIPSPIEVLS
ncbi:solute carrier family 35, member C2 [Nematocida sp. LUAm3]|nr:solute carrier family 35, member C2 [Nematocida sp. LUAm3]KAI5175588.1 solute carrier family 35, member C2 [Nematocida sp. LUAm2]KAI5178382.1 solute carrier family 35, member C2 [Nematocida sp. LUAm1]